ncbi:hypothetical protein K7472_17460 [Streptomyces sp. PTM05]|uniref:Uncharacterized protein n=2 Tax=Streptantibioticus parmotrematis TaxID=2873249 RepID=A0ABS7QTW7_9ACTN|nr:hypothetical protein [Streptantibioticus parmotrematis]
MRSPQECASWTWELESAGQDLGSVLATAARISSVFRDHGLLRPNRLAWGWFVFGEGQLRGSAQISLMGLELDSVTLAEEIQRYRPVGIPKAHARTVSLRGPGVWIDADGTERQEDTLVELIVHHDRTGVAADVSVHHDIWMPVDFAGVPHPAVYAANAPRLESALRAVEAELGVPAEPGEGTYFGIADGYGLAEPELDDNGRGPDLTDHL